ncbi:MAG: magnesium transporter [Sphingobium sp.]|uniref:magnesium transporter n=1 Tax=Sphingobium sp. TaxID=1912891 RepID=UPI0029B7AEB4|nr:magnesium transporter [Sphingobium sp.]MDX3910934.1 magnesium transporter [Sphingobium sp.]
MMTNFDSRLNSPRTETRTSADLKVDPQGLGSQLVQQVPTAQIDATAGHSRQAIIGKHWDLVDIVVLTDKDGRFEGVVDMRALLMADSSELMSALRGAWPVIKLACAPERAALTAHRHDVPALPVIDDGGIFVGCLRASALMNILWHEHAEDLHRFAGLQRETRGARQAFLFDSPFQRLRKRAPWLIVGAIGSALATSIMASFEAALAVNVTVAFFIPAIVYMADAVGTQSEAIAVRGLSLEHRNLGHVVVREAGTGLLIGALLGTIAFVGVNLAFGSISLALAVAFALFAASAFASIFGVVLPWLLDRCGFDPAFGAGPLATIVQDLASILLYLGMVQWLVL